MCTVPQFRELYLLDSANLFSQHSSKKPFNVLGVLFLQVRVWHMRHYLHHNRCGIYCTTWVECFQMLVKYILKLIFPLWTHHVLQYQGTPSHFQGFQLFIFVSICLLTSASSVCTGVWINMPAMSLYAFLCLLYCSLCMQSERMGYGSVLRHELALLFKVAPSLPLWS